MRDSLSKEQVQGLYEFDEGCKTSERLSGYMVYMETVEGFEKPYT